MLALIKLLFVTSVYEITLLVQFETDDINAENSLLTEAGILSNLETPNSNVRISSENGDANVFRSPVTLPLTKANTQFCIVDVAFVGKLSKTSDVRFVLMHWLIFVISSP